MVDFLIKNRWKVIVIDNFFGGNIKNLNQHKSSKNLKIIKKDITKIKFSDLRFLK